MFAIRLTVTLLLAGCSPTKKSPPPDKQAPVAQAGGLTCPQILQCYTPCGADAACLDACLQRGDQAAQAAVNALIDCSTRCNNDPNCVRTSCAAQLAPCQGTGASAPTQPHSTENILPWMTGTWTSSNYHFVFDADGTVQRSVSVALGGGCASTITASGPVTQEGDVLIMELGPETARNCNSPVEGGPAQRVRYQIEWVRVPDYSQGLQSPDKMQLRLRELDCTKGGELNCTELMNR